MNPYVLERINNYIECLDELEERLDEEIKKGNNEELYGLEKALDELSKLKYEYLKRGLKHLK